VPPRLRAVECDGITFPSGYTQYKQLVDEGKIFNGKQFVPDDEWIGGVLYPDHLGIAFTERVADVPQFVKQVEGLSQQKITSIRGTASKALPGDPTLLGDWIEDGTFDADRLTHKFEQELGGKWELKHSLKNPNVPQNGYNVEVNRVPGT
jgi:hypothetical protein